MSSEQGCCSHDVAGLPRVTELLPSSTISYGTTLYTSSEGSSECSQFTVRPPFGLSSREQDASKAKEEQRIAIPQKNLLWPLTTEE